MVSGVTITGLRKFDSAMDRMSRANQYPSKVMKAIGMRLRSMQMSHFKEEVDSEGKKWAPLKPETLARRGRIRRRRAKGRYSQARTKRNVREKRTTAPGISRTKRAPKILQDTGRLKASLTMRATLNYAIVGTNVIYAAPHQFGFPDKNIPKRGYLYINPTEREILVKMLSWELLWEPLTDQQLLFPLFG